MALNVYFDFFVNLKNQEWFELENRNEFNSFFKSWKILNFLGDFEKSSSIKDKLILKSRHIYRLNGSRNSFEFFEILKIWIYENYHTNQMALDKPKFFKIQLSRK